MDDRTATARDGTKVHAGRDLADELIRRHVFDWHTTDEADAEKGLENGEYHLIVRIPRDFSADLSTGPDQRVDPQVAQLRLVSGDATNYLSGIFSRTAFDEVRAAAAGLPPREAVAALVRAQLEYIRRYRAFAQLLLSEMWRTNREWQQTLVLLREQAIGVIAETVQAGVDSGDLPADLDVRVASSALFGVGLVVAVDWLVFQPERSIEDVEGSLLAIVRRVG
jgi:YhgE/Pip-like protein